MHRLALVALLAGCGKNYATVDEACSDEEPEGAEFGSDGGLEAFVRINCHRRLVGLREVAINEEIQQSVRSHAAYMDFHDDPGDAEEPGEAGFTGETVFERLDGAGLGIDWTRAAVWNLITEGIEQSPAEAIDELAHDAYLRQVVLQPDIIAGGFAQVGDWGYVNLVFRVPSTEHGARPFVYPVDGQQEVPVEWWSPYQLQADDGIPDNQPVGYPITVTVGSETGLLVSNENLYGLELLDASLTTSDGDDVPIHVVQPGMAAPITLLQTVLIVPEAPLDPNMEYALDVEVAWVDGRRRLQTTFHTQVDPD